MTRTLLSALVLLLAAGCIASPEETTHAPLPVVAWETALEEGPRVKVLPLVTGEIQVDRSFVLDFDHPNLENRTDAKLWVPVVAYLVRHPTAGDFLVDTGFDHTFAKSGHGNFGGVAFLASFARQEQGNDTRALLESLGVDLSTLKMIVLSHMHTDHTSGLPDLPKNLPLIIGAGAQSSYGGPWYAPANHLAGFEKIQTLSLPGNGEALDLLGDGSVLVLPTPGHAAGNLSFLVRAEGGPALLTCDASHTREGFDLGVAPGGVEDRGAAEKSLQSLRDFVSVHPEVRVKAGHEVSDWDLSRGVQDPL